MMAQPAYYLRVAFFERRQARHMHRKEANILRSAQSGSTSPVSVAPETQGKVLLLVADRQYAGSNSCTARQSHDFCTLTWVGVGDNAT